MLSSNSIKAEPLFKPRTEIATIGAVPPSWKPKSSIRAVSKTQRGAKKKPQNKEVDYKLEQLSRFYDQFNTFELTEITQRKKRKLSSSSKSLKSKRRRLSHLPSSKSSSIKPADLHLAKFGDKTSKALVILPSVGKSILAHTPKYLHLVGSPDRKVKFTPAEISTALSDISNKPPEKLQVTVQPMKQRTETKVDESSQEFEENTPQPEEEKAPVEKVDEDQAQYKFNGEESPVTEPDCTHDDCSGFPFEDLCDGDLSVDQSMALDQSFALEFSVDECMVPSTLCERETAENQQTPTAEFHAPVPIEDSAPFNNVRFTAVNGSLIDDDDITVARDDIEDFSEVGTIPALSQEFTGPCHQEVDEVEEVPEAPQMSTEPLAGARLLQPKAPRQVIVIEEDSTVDDYEDEKQESEQKGEDIDREESSEGYEIEDSEEEYEIESETEEYEEPISDIREAGITARRALSYGRSRFPAFLPETDTNSSACNLSRSKDSWEKERKPNKIQKAHKKKRSSDRESRMPNKRQRKAPGTWWVSNTPKHSENKENFAYSAPTPVSRPLTLFSGVNRYAYTAPKAGWALNLETPSALEPRKFSRDLPKMRRPFLPTPAKKKAFLSLSPESTPHHSPHQSPPSSPSSPFASPVAIRHATPHRIILTPMKDFPLTPSMSYCSTPIKYTIAMGFVSEEIYLPEELLVSVFQYLDSSRDLCSLACCCKRWMTISSKASIWKPLFFVNWGMTDAVLTTATESNSSWKAKFLSRKTEILMQQMKEGRSYATRKKLRAGGEKGLTGHTKSQLQRSNSGSGLGWFKRPVLQVETKEPKKAKTAKTRQKKEKELDNFLQQRAKFFDQFSEVCLSTTFIV